MEQHVTIIPIGRRAKRDRREWHIETSKIYKYTCTYTLAHLHVFTYMQNKFITILKLFPAKSYWTFMLCIWCVYSSSYKCNPSLYRAPSSLKSDIIYISEPMRKIYSEWDSSKFWSTNINGICLWMLRHERINAYTHKHSNSNSSITMYR